MMPRYLNSTRRCGGGERACAVGYGVKNSEPPGAVTACFPMCAQNSRRSGALIINQTINRNQNELRRWRSVASGGCSGGACHTRGGDRRQILGAASRYNRVAHHSRVFFLEAEVFRATLPCLPLKLRWNSRFSGQKRAFVFWYRRRA